MKFKLIYIVHGLILVLFIGSVIIESIRMYNFFESTGDDFSWHSFVIMKGFRITLFLVFPLIGVFLIKKIGWIFISHYFYFLLCNVFFQSFEEGFNNLLFLIVFETVIVLFLLMVNHQKVSFDCYKIQKKNLINYNLVSFVLGCCISALFFISKNLYYFNNNQLIQ